MVDVPPAAITAGENSFVTLGGEEITISARVGSSFVTPSNVVTLFAGIVLTYVPVILLST